MPQHIHVHVIEPGRCTYYIDDIVVRDDPGLTPEMIEHYSRGRGGPGVATPLLHEDSGCSVRRDIILGAGIPDYPELVPSADRAADRDLR